MLFCICKAGTKVLIVVLKEAYLSIQEAVQDGHHKTLQRHRRSKDETKTDTKQFTITYILKYCHLFVQDLYNLSIIDKKKSKSLKNPDIKFGFNSKL